MRPLYRLPDFLREKIRAIIEPKPRKRKAPLQEIVSGIVCLLSNGCKWRDLPTEYGHYKRVWYCFNRWTAYAMLDKLLYTSGGELRGKQGRRKEPSLVIIDAQAAKNHDRHR